MSLMSVTLDVSKLSGWLNAGADCRVESRGMRCGRGVWCGPRGGRVASCGAGVCAERTLNMNLMSVTLDVSKLSGWLNALAACRVE